MAFSIKMEVDRASIRELDRRRKGVKELIKDSKDRRIVLQQVKHYLAQRWLENFADEGAIYGKWKGLAEATADTREQQGYGRYEPILVRTETLAVEFSEQGEDEARLNAASVRWNFHDTADAFPVSHHLGFPNPMASRTTSSSRKRSTSRQRGGPRDIPARKLWDINDEDEARISVMLEDWFEMIFNKNLG